MKEIKKLYLSLMIVLLLICGCGGGSDSTISPSNTLDMTGVWEGTMVTPERSERQIRFDLTQIGPNISGEMTFDGARSEDVTGSVEGSTVTISVIFPARGGGQLELAYAGPVEGNTFSGTFTYFLRGNIEDEGTFSLLSNDPVPNEEFAISFEWGNIPLCTSGQPNTVYNPRFVLSNVPANTDYIEFTMTDLNVPTFDHGGGRVQYTGQNVIESGAFLYQSPCPPNGSHHYEWTATAKNINNATTGEARSSRNYPE